MGLIWASGPLMILLMVSNAVVLKLSRVVYTQQSQSSAQLSTAGRSHAAVHPWRDTPYSDL